MSVVGNARRKFSIGDRVVLNTSFSGYPEAKIRTGEVTGFGVQAHTVRIRLDGLTRKGKIRTPETWSMGFWDVMETNPEP